MDVFLGCWRRERLQPARTTPKNKKAFLVTVCASKESLARINDAEKNTELKRDKLTQP
ncbi:hypothetical protein CAG70_00715 [Photobacterium halotolerans]|nr:hypothetical protein [Photobacterium halotolerans]